MKNQIETVPHIKISQKERRNSCQSIFLITFNDILDTLNQDFLKDYRHILVDTM